MANPLQRWTLTRRPAGGGSDETRTLAAWGAVAATLTLRNQAAGELRLSVPVADFAAAATIGWLDRLTLRRPDGTVFWRGTAQPPAAAATAVAHARDLVALDAWWWLERTPCMELWSAAADGPPEPVDPDDPEGDQFLSLQAQPRWMPRVVLGEQDPFDPADWSAPAEAETMIATGEVIRRGLDYAAARGCPLAAGNILAGMRVPDARDLRDASCAEVLRAALRWHPGAALRLREEAGGTFVDVLEADDLAPAPVDLASASHVAEALTLRQRPDLVPTCVALLGVGRRGLRGGGEVVLSRWQIYPPDEDPRQPGAEVHTIDLGELGNGKEAGDTSADPPPGSGTRMGGPAGGQAQRVTSVLVEETSVDWWRIHLPQVRGLAPGNMAIRGAAWDVSPDQPLPPEWDPDDPPADPPAKADVPRELRSGQIERWMPWQAAEAEATAVMIWTGPDSEQVLKAFPAWWFEGGQFFRAAALAVRFTATDAPRSARVQAAGGMSPAPAPPAGAPANGRLHPAGGVAPPTPGTEPDVSSGAVTANAATGGQTPAQVLAGDYLGLAQQLFEDRQRAAWEGSLTLSAADLVDLPDLHPGRAVSILGGHPDWEEAAVPIQSVALSLHLGQARVEAGTPGHLTLQDWLALRRGLRPATASSSLAARRRAVGRGGASPVGSGEDGQWEQEEGPTVGGLATATAGTATASGAFDPSANFAALRTLNGRTFMGPGVAVEIYVDEAAQAVQQVTWEGAAWGARRELPPSTAFYIVRHCDEQGRLTSPPNVTASPPTPQAHRPPGTDSEMDPGQPGIYVADFAATDADAKLASGPNPGQWAPPPTRLHNAGVGARLSKGGTGSETKPWQVRSLIGSSGAGTIPIRIEVEELADEIRILGWAPEATGSGSGTGSGTPPPSTPAP